MSINIVQLLFLVISLISLCQSSTESCSTSVVPGPITWTDAGTAHTNYLIQAGGTDSWGHVSPSGSEVTVGLGPRFYMANTCASAFSYSVFERLYLLGATLSFTVNLSNVGCGCDAAFYLVSMTTDPGSNGDYYCDSNCVGGQCCTEMDIMEANSHALQITPHRCTSPTSGCDGNGCARNTQSISNGYGPGSTYTINTLDSFNVKMTFHETNKQLSSITTIISQGSKSITITHDSSCGSNYLEGLTSAFTAGLVPVWSFWSGSISWLDSPACPSDNCNSNAQFIFSNLVVTGAGSAAPSGPTPTAKAPTAPPKAPTAPPKAPPTAPTAPSSLTCKNGVSNPYFLEFYPPSGSSNPASQTASITCSNGFSVSCTWESSLSKFQCPSSGKPCVGPTPVYGSKHCPYPNQYTCGNSGCTINSGWVEFLPPSSNTATPPSSGYVGCSGGTALTCSYAYGVKYQCSGSCSNPVPIWNGQNCPYPPASVVADDQTTAHSNILSDLSTPAIVGIAVGCFAGVIVLIAIVVVLVKRKKHEENV